MKWKIVLGFEVLLAVNLMLYLIFISYQNYADLQVSIGNSLMSKNSMTLMFKEDSLPKLGDLDFIFDDDESLTLYSVIAETYSINIYGYYKNFNINSPLVELDEKAKNEKYPQAVLGESLYSGHGKENIFHWREKKYRIDGKFFSDTSGLLDTLAYIRLEPDDVLTTSKFILDGSKVNEVMKAADKIKAIYNIEILRSSDNVIKNILFSEQDMERFNLLSSSLLTIMLIILMIYYNYYSGGEIKVKRILGISNRRIITSSLWNLCIQTLGGLALAVMEYSLVYMLYLKRISLANGRYKLFAYAAAVLLIVSIIHIIYYKSICVQIRKNGVK